jgi:hypothetical protein
MIGLICYQLLLQKMLHALIKPHAKICHTRNLTIHVVLRQEENAVIADIEALQAIRAQLELREQLVLASQEQQDLPDLVEEIQVLPVQLAPLAQRDPLEVQERLA